MFGRGERDCIALLRASVHACASAAFHPKNVIKFVPRAVFQRTCAVASTTRFRPRRDNMAKQPGAIKQAWYKWKALRLPWRKKWLVGMFKKLSNHRLDIADQI